MELRVFKFIDDVSGILDDRREKLDGAAEDIKDVFREILVLNNEAYMNVTTRVKGKESLKEKILRNNYFKKYQDPELVIDNLSDLIGVRVECRFIEDEKKVYKIFKKYFNKKDEESGLYYNRLNSKIKMDFSGIQPQEQKNGFKIYRIDGVYIDGDFKANFELQIKSLVNVFWSEIEHKVVYKNNNYMVWNRFFKDIMGAIKKNLTLIDNQLEIVYNQFNEMNEPSTETRKEQLEQMLSKMIYEIYSNKMKDSIGIVVDFNSACDTIMKYILRTRGADDLEEYKNVVLRMFSRLNELGKNKIDFNSSLEFSREPRFKGDFAQCFGTKMMDMINEDFQWNLFFRILFEIELGSNVEDFEMFINFLEEVFVENNFEYLDINFKEDEKAVIQKDVMNVICDVFDQIDSIEFIYENMIHKINKATRKNCKRIAVNIKDMEAWEEKKYVFLSLYRYKILSLFKKEVSVVEAKELIREIDGKNERLEISPSVIEYLHTLDDRESIAASTVLKFFKE